MLIKLLNVLSCPLLEPGGTDSHLISKPYSKPALIAEKVVGITTGKECVSKSLWTGKVCSCHHDDKREASQHLLGDSDTWPDRERLHTPQHVNCRGEGVIVELTHGGKSVYCAPTYNQTHGEKSVYCAPTYNQMHAKVNMYEHLRSLILTVSLGHMNGTAHCRHGSNAATWFK